jgi:hypothetical protein
MPHALRGQRSGDCGCPDAVGSTNPWRSVSRVGSFASVFLRPPRAAESAAGRPRRARSLFRRTGPPRFGQAMNDVRNVLLNRSDPAERQAGLFVWHMIAFEVFSSQRSSS